MKSIILKSKKLSDICVLYDDIDHELVSKYNWYAIKNGKAIYAISTKKNPEKKSILMHRLILGITDPNIIIDHKNGCGLDNTRGNIRIASKSQNAQNTGINCVNSTGYKGVTVIKRKNIAFRSRIVVNGTQISLGVFKTERDAALAYNMAAIKYFGEFACINNIT